jgi:hypothetical protein
MDHYYYTVIYYFQIIRLLFYSTLTNFIIHKIIPHLSKLNLSLSSILTSNISSFYFYYSIHLLFQLY